MKDAVLLDRIERRIYLIRGQKVMLSTDIAQLYKVEPKVLVQAVKRNIERFPKDFMFQLNPLEYTHLKSQIVTSSWGGVRRANPYAFTEQGVAMLSSVLHSERAVRINIEIMRVFVHLRAMISENQALARRFDRLRKDYKAEFENVWDAIEELREPPHKSKPQIGFRPQSASASR